MTTEQFVKDLDEVTKHIKSVLIHKNTKYGDAALNPNQIFSSCDAIELLNVRIDDKLSRIKNNENDDEDAELDLLGYLILKRIALKRRKENTVIEQGKATFDLTKWNSSGIPKCTGINWTGKN